MTPRNLKGVWFTIKRQLLAGSNFLFLMMKFHGVLTIALMIAITIDLTGQVSQKAAKKHTSRAATFANKVRFGTKVGYQGIGFSLGTLNYYGDLSPLPQKSSTDLSLSKPAYGISFFRRLGPRFTMINQFMYGTLEGSDANSAKPSDLNNGVYRYNRNLSFRNHIKELSLVVEFDLFKNDAVYVKRQKHTPYVFVGIAIFEHNPMAKEPARFLDGLPNPDAGKWVALQPLGTEGQYSTLTRNDVNYGSKPYPLVQVAIPFGMGVRIQLNDFIDLWADIGLRYTFTDYLDDVSKNYVDLNLISAKDPGQAKLAQAMSYRTNEAKGNPGSSTSGENINSISPNSFGTWPGYGSEGRDNVRGHSKSVDMYMVSSLKITYILRPSYYGVRHR